MPAKLVSLRRFASSGVMNDVCPSCRLSAMLRRTVQSGWACCAQSGILVTTESYASPKDCQSLSESPVAPTSWMGIVSIGRTGMSRTPWRRPSVAAVISCLPSTGSTYMSRMARYAEYRSADVRPSPRRRAAAEPAAGTAGAVGAVSVGLGVARAAPGLAAGAGVTMRLPPEPPPLWGVHATNTETDTRASARMKRRGTCTETRACGCDDNAVAEAERYHLGREDQGGHPRARFAWARGCRGAVRGRRAVPLGCEGRVRTGRARSPDHARGWARAHARRRP